MLIRLRFCVLSESTAFSFVKCVAIADGECDCARERSRRETRGGGQFDGRRGTTIYIARMSASGCALGARWGAARAENLKKRVKIR